MSMPLCKNHPLFKIANGAVAELPTPANISVLWNFCSLLGPFLIIQIATGLFLAMHYTFDINLAFSSVAHICWDVSYGWLLQTLHANGASFFFMFMYTYRTSNLLQLIPFPPYMISSSCNFISSYSNCFPGLGPTMSSNII